MTIKFVDTDGELIIPGAYPKYKVAEAAGGLATTGVVLLVGEAEFGPQYSEEDISETSVFGADSFGAVAAKYGAGPLVDAYKAVVNASKDAQVSGAPTNVILAKTNLGSYAQAVLTGYQTLKDLKGGDLGNLLYTSVSDTAEVGPQTPWFTYIDSLSDPALIQVRTNGNDDRGTAGITVITLLGRALQNSVNENLQAWGVAMIGGAYRNVLNGLGARTLSATAAGSTLLVDISVGPWAVLPTLGDVLEIPGGSSIAGAGSANVGKWMVTAVTNTRISLYAVTTTGAPVSVAGPAAIAGDATFFVHGPVALKMMSGNDSTDRNVMVVGHTINGTYAAGKLTLADATGTWANNPKLGDNVYISQNTAPATWQGWYTVDSATSNTMVLSPVDSVQAAEIVNGSFVVASATLDVYVRRPDVNGVGKTLEVWSGAGTQPCWKLVGTTPTGMTEIFNPDTVTSNVFVSTQEKVATINVSRQSTNTFEQLTAGGTVVLKVGYVGSGGSSFAWNGTKFTMYGVGGVGDGTFEVFASGMRTISDLVAFINSKPGWTAAAGSALYGQLPVTCLDQGTFLCEAKSTNYTARIKKDAYDMVKAVANSTVTRFVANPVTGLPDFQDITYFSGGAKGLTSNAYVTGALEAGEQVRANFVVTLFSRDASEDIDDALTDTGSTYDIGSVNAALSAHCSKMSQFKRRRPRQGFASIRGSFLDAKLMAQNLASARISCTFQDVKALNADGVLTQFQPWMGAVVAAGMQAAAFYRPIFNRNLNVSGIVQAAGDWYDSNESMVEEALNNGLLTFRKAETGGFRFVSDQTTYGIDNNFVYNSIQAVYAADTVAMTIARRMEDAFVGQSFADVSAAVALGYLKGIMSDLRRVKLITASDDAVEGYKNASIVINAPAMLVSLEVKLSTGVYFIPIKFLVTQVQQTATA